MCFVDQKIAYDRVPRKVMMLCEINLKWMPVDVVRSVAGLSEGVKRGIRKDSELSD